MKRLLLASIALLFSSGCVCFPFATPPLELSGGAGMVTQDGRVGAAFPLDINAKPAGAFVEGWDRNYDIGVGYRFTPTTLGRAHHGPTLQLAILRPISIHRPVDGKSDLGMRFGFAGQGHLILGNVVDDLGAGATFRFTTEWVGYDDGPFDNCATEDDDLGYQDLDGDGYNDYEEDEFSCSVGHAFGEAGIGLFAEASYLDLGNTNAAWVGIGVLFRVPAAVGIAIASIFD